MEEHCFDLAVDAFTRLVDLAPHEAEPLILLANALQAQGNPAAAIPNYQRALECTPQHPAAWGSLGRAYLLEGLWKDGLSAIDKQLSLQPGHSEALALKSIALQEMGRPETWKNLVDFERLICGFEITPDRETYPNLEAFNRKVAAYCEAHPQLVYEPKNNTTTLGWQTPNLVDDPEPVIADLLAAIEDCVDRYLESHPVDDQHPFLSQRPNSWKFNLWATLLSADGHQESHIHRDGWLSGVYYAQVPPTIAAGRNNGNTDGWIEFGKPRAYPKAQSTPETRRYRPVEGRLYLFPSYFYHRTIPFKSDTRRISLAFDLIPQG